MVLALGVRHYAHAYDHAYVDTAHAHAHDTITLGDATPPGGGAAAPAPTPLGCASSERGHGDGGDACAIWGLRAMFDLTALCDRRGWALQPRGGDRYVVTTGAGVAADRHIEHDRDGA